MKPEIAPWILAAVASSVSYGINNILMKVSSARISSIAGALLIQIASMAVVAGYFCFAKWVRGEALACSWPGALSALGSGVMTGIGLIFLVSAFRSGGPMSLTMLILLTGQIVIAALAGWFLFQEGFSPARLLGFLFCSVGLWLASSR